MLVRGGGFVFERHAERHAGWWVERVCEEVLGVENKPEVFVRRADGRQKCARDFLRKDWAAGIDGGRLAPRVKPAEGPHSWGGVGSE